MSEQPYQVNFAMLIDDRNFFTQIFKGAVGKSAGQVGQSPFQRHGQPVQALQQNKFQDSQHSVKELTKRYWLIYTKAMDEGYFKENDFATEASKRIDAFENYSKEYIQTQNAIKLVALVDNFKQFVEWLEGHFLDWKGRKLQQSQTLPPGWVQKQDKNGKIYYWHTLSGEIRDFEERPLPVDKRWEWNCDEGPNNCLWRMKKDRYTALTIQGWPDKYNKNSPVEESISQESDDPYIPREQGDPEPERPNEHYPWYR